MKKITLSLLIVTLFFSGSMSFSGENVNEIRLGQFKYKDTLSVSEALALNNLNVLSVNNLNNSKCSGEVYTITSFQLLTAPKVGNAEGFWVIGNSFSQIIKERFKSGTKVLFGDILYTRNDGSKGKIESYMFYIK